MSGMENSSRPAQTDASSPPAVAADAAALLPGAALAAARVAQGLSLEDVARQLKLSVVQIKSIEADDHSRLPSPVFVRGFIRTYARVVKLDVAQLLPPKVVAAETPDVRMLQDAPGVSMDPSPYRRVPAILAGIACVLLALAYYEFVLNAPPAPPVPAASALPAPTPTPIPVPAPALAESVVAAAVAAVETPKLEAPKEQLILKKSGEPVSDAVRGLRFVFNGKSWVEVRDAEGKIVFSKTNAAGTERRVQGDPPFSVVVGGASNVQLSYNGRVVDLAAYSTEDVARLLLE